MNVNISIGYSASDISYEDVELEFKTGEVNNILHFIRLLLGN